MSRDYTLERYRNFGIMAHIDAGKTTATERILYYTGRSHKIGEVHDGNATMDWMEQEQERGITITSAATTCFWFRTDDGSTPSGEYTGDAEDAKFRFNIIDTPGHVDFTIEVERALRVLDGAILVLCSVGGVQSQSITVDRQMRRYAVPRLCFINKCDRTGADPWKVLKQVREKLRLNAAAVHVPIGLEENHAGVVDLVRNEAVTFHGPNGNDIKIEPVPENMKALVAEKRRELIEAVAEVDDELGELFLMGEEPTTEQLKAAIRRATVAREFAPLFMGSAFKNKGVQLLLDGVVDYLPAPHEVSNVALDLNDEEKPVELAADPKAPLVGLAFKLEEGRFGQLTYLRIYQGTIAKGGSIVNTSTGKKLKVPRLVRMHSEEMEDVSEAKAGEIVALFGVDCKSGDTFTSGDVNLAMTSMKVPEPVMSLAVSPKSRAETANFSKALSRFQREDPTFKVRLDEDAWNARDPARVAALYAADARVRTPEGEFLAGRAAIMDDLERKWHSELDYRLVKQLWCSAGSKISVVYQYEYRVPGGCVPIMSADGSISEGASVPLPDVWWRAHGTELYGTSAVPAFS